MNQKFDPHKSSVMETDANLVALSLYLVPLLSNFMSLGIISWVLPLVILFIEKKSPLVCFHAVQSLIMQATVAVFNLVVVIAAFMSAGSSILIGFNVIGAFGVVGIVGLLSAAVSVIVIALEIVGIIKAYGWENYYLPIFGTITRRFTKE